MNSVMSHPSKRQLAVSAIKLWIASESGKTFATIDPATGAGICQVSEADAGDVEKAVRATRVAFEQGPWRNRHQSEEVYSTV